MLLACVCVHQSTHHTYTFASTPVSIPSCTSHHQHHHHSREKKKKQHHCPNCRKPLALGLAVAELDFVRRAAVLQSLLFCFVLLVCFFSCGKVCGDDGGCYLSGDLLKDQFGLFLVEWRREEGTEVCLLAVTMESILSDKKNRFVAGTVEKRDLNQYWYSPHTIAVMVQVSTSSCSSSPQTASSASFCFCFLRTCFRCAFCFCFIWRRKLFCFSICFSF